MMDSRAYINSLRQIADFLEAHPDLPTPHSEKLTISTGDLPGVAHQIGSCQKVVDETFYNLQKKFGVITLEFYDFRQSVCKKVSKGTRLIPETIVPAKPEQVIAAHEIEEFDWVCPDSLLEKGEI
jgi:hypothetical protein